MNQINIFFQVVIIFFITLIFTSLVFCINTPEFEKYLEISPGMSETLQFIFRNSISLHQYFIIFSLLITFAIYYSFVNLKEFKVYNYVLAIIAVPVIICICIYYFENYMLKGLYRFKAFILISFPPADYTINVINDFKIYHFSFLVFIIIPGAILLNNEKWYLKTFIFLFIYSSVTIFLFKYVNKFILIKLDSINILKELKVNSIIKKLPDINEIILFIIYIPLGIYILKLADSIRKIRKRIDIGKIKKIQRK